MPDSADLPPTRPGPLDGLTLAVKDMIAIEGRASSFGHPRWRATHAPSASTAPVVSRLLTAGASVTGLAKLDQLAYSLIGNAGEGTPPLNSLYPGRFTGGSSSGPAAAVAAGLADVGLGTDTAGSIRVPAASCGLFGLRPTHGSVSSAGVLPLAPSFDVVGLLARGTGTLGRALGLLSSSPDDARTPAAGRAVTVPADCLDGTSAAAAQAVYATARQIASAAGCTFAECRLAGFVSQDAADLFARIQARQVWQVHGPWLSQNGDALAADVRARVERAEALSAGPQAQAGDDEREWRSYQRGLDQALPHGSVIVLPVIPDLPPRRDASAAELSAFRAGALRYTAPASLAGRPELVIPVRHLASGTKLGIGLLGEAGDDLALLRIASRLCGGHHQLTV